MSTRAIRTSTPQTACDVCGRTLLRGERAEIYLSGADRHSVCELCTSRALHGGWVREGTVPDYGPARQRVDRRRSLLGLRRSRRRAEPAPVDEEFTPPPEFLDDADVVDPLDIVATTEPQAGPEAEPAPDWPQPPARAGRRRRASGLRSRGASPGGGSDAAREPSGAQEPRHVHAVPTSVEHRVDAAVELFNASEHPRTVAGITRSLGLPDVSVHPSSPVGAIVNLVLAWELCWYRYEVDLSVASPVVRDAGKGYELTELEPVERQCNALAAADGRLSVRG